jgi:hypothetical protein
MAVYTGLGGAIATGSGAGTKIANIKNWSLTIDVASNDTTSFADTNTTAVQGLRNASCQVAGDLSTDATQKTLLRQVGSTGTLSALTLSLYISTVAGRKAKFYATGGQLTNIGVGSEVAGVASFTASFQLSGGAKYSTT